MEVSIHKSLIIRRAIAEPIHYWPIPLQSLKPQSQMLGWIKIFRQRPNWMRQMQACSRASTKPWIKTWQRPQKINWISTTCTVNTQSDHLDWSQAKRSLSLDQTSTTTEPFQLWNRPSITSFFRRRWTMTDSIKACKPTICDTHRAIWTGWIRIRHRIWTRSKLCRWWMGTELLQRNRPNELSNLGRRKEVSTSSNWLFQSR